MLTLVVILALSYALGAVPWALVVSRARGVDLRSHGSGNAGATNAMRVLGKGPGALVFGLDFAKGLAATLLVSQVRLEGGLPDALGSEANQMAWARVFCGAAAMAGHVFTVWGAAFFGGWKGGKGVATGTGMLAGLMPGSIAVAVALFAVVVWATRYVSLGSILATVSLPLTLLIGHAVGIPVPKEPVWVFAFAVPAFIVWTHRQNVRRLLSGTESRIGSGAG